MIKNHILVFDLSYHEVLKHHIPKAVVVEKENAVLVMLSK
jgi:hypothetical protein